MKDHLVFDITDAQSILDSDQVGAVIQGVRSGAKQRVNSQLINSLEWLNVAAAVFAGDGTAVTQTGGALDVNIATSDIGLAVDMDGDYDASTNPAPDSVGLIAHDRATTPGIADQNQRPTAGELGPVVGEAVSTVHALDVNAFLYGIDDSADAVQLQVESVSAGLKVYLAGVDAVETDSALANTSVANASNTLNVADTAEDVVASPLSNRKYLYISNNDNKKIFVGTTGVSATNGFPVSPGSVLMLRAGAAVAVKFVGQAGATPEIRTLELS